MSNQMDRIIANILQNQQHSLETFFRIKNEKVKNINMYSSIYYFIWY